MKQRLDGLLAIGKTIYVRLARFRFLGFVLGRCEIMILCFNGKVD